TKRAEDARRTDLRQLSPSKPLQVLDELGRGLIPAARIFLETLEADPFQGKRDSTVEPAGARRILLDDLQDQVERAGLVEYGPPRQQLEQNRANAVDVAARRNLGRGAPRLFRRHVSQR